MEPTQEIMPLIKYLIKSPRHSVLARVKHAQRSSLSGQRQLLRSFGFSTAGIFDPLPQGRVGARDECPLAIYLLVVL